MFQHLIEEIAHFNLHSAIQHLCQLHLGQPFYFLKRNKLFFYVIFSSPNWDWLYLFLYYIISLLKLKVKRRKQSLFAIFHIFTVFYRLVVISAIFTISKHFSGFLRCNQDWLIFLQASKILRCNFTFSAEIR